MLKSKRSAKFPFPVFVAREGRWFVAECPMLNIATQGRTKKEVRENMKDLISERLQELRQWI